MWVLRARSLNWKLMQDCAEAHGASATGRIQNVVASMLRSMLVTLLLTLSLTPQSSWWAAFGLGAVYGFWTASFIVLSKAESAGQHAVYILRSALATGVVIGALIRWFSMS